MTSREQFERHVGSEDALRRVCGEDAESLQLEDGDYYYLSTREGWSYWQASRAALVVTLPTAYTLSEMDYKRDVVSELEAAGVRVSQ